MLFEHQKRALAWSAGKNDFACFMEMRTGKSLVAINKVKEWKSKKVLLVAPLSTWFDWRALFKQEGINFLGLLGPTKQKRDWLCNWWDNTHWIMINPEGITAWGKEFFTLIDNDIDTCVLDESPFIKNPRAKITKLLMKNAYRFQHHMIMTGTPIAEHTEDIVTQMIWCHGEFMGKDNFYSWRCQYMRPSKFGWRLKKGVAEFLRETLKRESFVLSAKDAKLFTTQVKQTHLVELPKTMRKDYHEIETSWALDEASTKFGVVKDSWLAQLSSGIYPRELGIASSIFKYDYIKRLLEDQLKDQQVIIFSRWLAEVFHISNQLQCTCITGNTPYAEREKLLGLFRNGQEQYLVCQTKTACRGLDLSCVNTAIICSNYWQHEIRAQILARMKHPLKQIPTLVIDIITKDTIEEQVYQLLEEKHDNARYFLQRLKAKVKRTCRVNS